MSNYILTSSETTYTLFLEVYCCADEKPVLTNSDIYYTIKSLIDENLPTLFFSYDTDDLKKALSYQHTDFNLYRENGIIISVKLEIVAIGENEFVVKMECVKRGLNNDSKKS